MAKRLRKGTRGPMKTALNVSFKEAEESFNKMMQRLALEGKIPPDTSMVSFGAQSKKNNTNEIQKKPPLEQKALRKLLSQKKIDAVAEDLKEHPENLSYACGLLLEKPAMALNAASAIKEASYRGADLSPIVRRLFETGRAQTQSQSIDDESKKRLRSFIADALEYHAKLSPMIPEIAEFLSCDDVSMQYTALTVLGGLFKGRSPVYLFLLPTIESCLEDSHSNIRWAGGVCLSYHHLNENDSENLIRLLTHKNPDVRCGAFNALLNRFLNVPYDSLMQTLLVSLGDETKDVRSDTLEILTSYPSIKGEGATKKIMEELSRFINSKMFIEQAEMNTPFYVRAVKSMSALCDHLQNRAPDEI